MSAVFSDLRVVELSNGIAAPMVGMLASDFGADVVRIEPPGGDDSRTDIGFKVWNRGKRSAELDVGNADDLDVIKSLVGSADIFISSLEESDARTSGLDYKSLSARNPALIQLSITGYGGVSDHEGRPARDALVAARTGLQWEQRGFPQGAVNRMVGRPDPFPDLEIPYDDVQGAPREGPLFSASKWPSLGAFFSGWVALCSALYARQRLGRGQLIETSLLNGAMAGGCAVWLRAENPDAEGFDTWILGSKSPKGHFECSDGGWVHNWVPNPRFIITASEGDQLNATPDLTVQNDPDRFGIGPEEILVMSHYQPILADAVKRFPQAEWVDAAATAGMTMQPVRSPEQSLADPWLLQDGCVVEIDDPELGPIRQVGLAYNMSEFSPSIERAAPALGAHTDEIRKEAKTPSPPTIASNAAGATLDAGDAPLKGVRVLDLGLAVAGPFGGQQLADLGAEVIKVNAIYDMYWHRTHMAFMCNRGKRSIALNLKDPRGMKVLMQLIDSADVLLHNMRYDAAERLGIDYASLKESHPRLIYCHSRGFEKGSPRESLPGNDQTGACLSGIQWEDGGMNRGGKPIWSLTSFGDTGNGFLCAAAVASALYHRDQTGKGQMVDTSIINACLLNTSYVAARPDGSGFERDHLDGMQFGYHAGQRLYQTSDGWVCIDVGRDESQWQALTNLFGLPTGVCDDPESRRQNDQVITDAIEKQMLLWSADAAWNKLNDAGIDCEVSNPDAIFSALKNSEFRDSGQIAEFNHQQVGRLELTGLLYKFSDTPGKLDLPPLIVGEHTIEILSELGYSEEEIQTLATEGAALVAGGEGTRSPWE